MTGDPSKGQRISIFVQIEFEIGDIRETRTGKQVADKKRYRLVRSAYEKLDGTSHHRSASTVKLVELTDIGAKLINPPEAVINDILPPELREVFFTDNNRAPSFIEAESITARRKHVQEAIRLLLGLNVIEEAFRHVKRTTSELNKDAKKIGSDEMLVEIATELEQIDKNISDFEVKRDDAKLQFDSFSQSLSEIDKEIEASLFKGDRETLNLELKQTKLQLDQVNKQQIEVSKAHSDLFGSLFLLRDLLNPVFQKSLTKLNELRDQGAFSVIPIHVIEELLRSSTCVCGELLDPYTSDGEHRRKHLQSLIDMSREPDALQKILVDLYYASSTLHLKEISDNEHWGAKYSNIVNRRDELEILQAELEQRLKVIELQLDNIPDVDISRLHDTKQEYIVRRDHFNAVLIKYEIQLKNLKAEHRASVATRNNLLTKQKRGTRTLARLEVARDIEQVLQNSYERITNQELVKLSDLMNHLFLEMIGENSVIQKAAINKDFDILVYGPNNVLLAPKDMGGPARRTLPLAFIFALTKVSEVEAPNVIDSLLGLMSGYVKRSLLKTTIQESSQPILFLTRTEIQDCEDIIDSEAGRVITLTNPTHHLRMLANNPPVEELKILRCECNHRQECGMCMQRTSVEE